MFTNGTNYFVQFRNGFLSLYHMTSSLALLSLSLQRFLHTASTHFSFHEEGHDLKYKTTTFDITGFVCNDSSELFYHLTTMYTS